MKKCNLLLVLCLVWGICPAQLTVTVNGTNASCNSSCDGSATATASGGATPYSYMWPTGNTGATVTGLCAGSYVVTATDALAAQAVDSITIAEPPALVLTMSKQDAMCGQADGQATGLVTGGTPGYTYLWSALSITTATVTGLTSGTYTITITDANGCTITGTAAINDSLGINFDLAVEDDSSGNCSGTVEIINLGGGFPPYTYTWNNGLTGSSRLTGACSGQNYCVTVTESNGCQDTRCSASSGPPVVVNPFKKLISGRVYIDMNANCAFDPTDFPMPGEWITISPGHWARTDASGNYAVSVNNGSYWISHYPSNKRLTRLCPAGNITLNVTATDTFRTGNDFVYGAPDTCSSLEVTLSHIGYRRCFESMYVVNYCNYGVQTRESWVQLTLPDIVTVDTTTSHKFYGYNRHIDPDSSVGNTYFFGLGLLSPGFCGTFWVLIDISCDAVMNETHCVEVEIFPQKGCEDPDSTWDRSSLKVEGRCDGDSLACFTIYNTGEPGNGDMAGYSEYRIYVDNVWKVTDSVMIAGGDSVDVCYPAGGKTIRLEADQRPGHPGKSRPRDHVEGCGNPPYSRGQIERSMADNLDKFRDVYCGPVVSSWDPNDKRVRPAGINDTYHYVEEGARLQYLIRFQNTGNDTAFKIIVMDTLSQYLRITSVIPGASSHPYQFRVIGSNVLQFTFYDILLPDSNTNEPMSHGFVNFTVEQDSAVPVGTVITNRVGILFDYNDPVMTNTVWSTVGIPDSILLGRPPSMYLPGVRLLVYPNPAGNLVNVSVSGGDFNQAFSARVFGLDGRLQVSYTDLREADFTVDMSGMADGVYILEISSGEDILGRQPVIIVRR